jgi:hypothetical protein
VGPLATVPAAAITPRAAAVARSLGAVRRRSVTPVLVALLTVVIVAQRLIIPIDTGLPLLTLLFPVAVIVLWRRGVLAADRGRTMAYVVAMSGCVTSALFVQEWGGAFSVPSLAQLLFLYAPFCFTLTRGARAEYPALLEAYGRIMMVVAVVAIIQMAIQLAGVAYEDPFRFIPSQFINRGYNTLAPVSYGSPIFRANAIVFLEPSFVSQFLALAIVIGLVQQFRWYRLALYGIGILTSVSGTGVLLIGFSVAVLILVQGRKWILRILLPMAITVVAVYATPAASIFAERIGEHNEENSSFTQRFTAPLSRANELLTVDDRTFFVGLGPGAADRDADEVFKTTGLPISYSPIAKLSIEYGLVATIIFTTFVLYLFFTRVPSFVISYAIAIFYFLLSSALLQPSTQFVCWIFTSLFAIPSARSIVTDRAATPASAIP